MGAFLRAPFAIYVKSNSPKCPFFAARHWQWRRMCNHISPSNYLIPVIARANREERTGCGRAGRRPEAEAAALASRRHREETPIGDSGSRSRLRAALGKVPGSRRSRTPVVPVEKYSFISIGATVNSDQEAACAAVNPTAFTFIFCHFGNYVNQGPQLK